GIFAEIDDLCGRRRCKQGAGQKGSADQASVKHGSSFDQAETRPGRVSTLPRDTHIRSRIIQKNAQYDFLAPPDRERNGRNRGSGISSFASGSRGSFISILSDIGTFKISERDSRSPSPARRRPFETLHNPHGNPHTVRPWCARACTQPISLAMSGLPCLFWFSRRPRRLRPPSQSYAPSQAWPAHRRVGS